MPLDGTVTSFAVNSGSAGNMVELRVLQPAGGGQFTAIASGPTETLAGGPQSFSVSLPVKAGEVLALDNGDSALLFDTTTSTDTAWYYQSRARRRLDRRADHPGARLPPARQRHDPPEPDDDDDDLDDDDDTSTTTPPVPPVLSHVSQTHKTWRLGTKLATISSSKKPPPVGTTFKFDLNQVAQVSFAFEQLFPARKVKGRCVPQTSHNLHASKCTRYGRSRTMSLTAAAGSDKVAFDGRVSRSTKLKNGSYEVSIQASAAGGRSNTETLKFTFAS